MSVAPLVRLEVKARRRRMAALVAFGLLFVAAALTGRFLAKGPHGQVEVGQLFVVGGYPLVSALLLLGWIIGRFPLIAVLVLMAGVFSADRSAGYARLYAVRPVSPLRVYGARWLALAAVAFILSAMLLPGFDLLMLGTWAGGGTFVLIAAYILAYGGLTAFLSVWTRGDAWIALLVGVFALVWNALLQAGALAGAPPGVTRAIALVVPPQAEFLRLEGAFAGMQAIPWDAFAYIAGYGVVMLVLAGVSVAAREI